MQPEQMHAADLTQQINKGLLDPRIALERFNQAPATVRKFNLPSLAERTSKYHSACEQRDVFQKNKQPFITPDFMANDGFFLSQGLTLVGARSGQSKSTTAANILAGFIRFKPDTTAVVISNEEGTDTILNRTACVLLEKNFMEFHDKKLPEKVMQNIRDKSMELLSRIIIVDDPGWKTNCIEDVISVLDSAMHNGTHMVLIDYLQTINTSKLEPSMESFQVLKKFGVYIRDFGRRSAVPVVVFAQLEPKSVSSDFQRRVQNDKTIYNDAFNVVEIDPNFDTSETIFRIHKQRFGENQGKETTMKFVGGRYEALDWRLP